jgi:hypothetical protein
MKVTNEPRINLTRKDLEDLVSHALYLQYGLITEDLKYVQVICGPTADLEFVFSATHITEERQDG